MNYENQLEGVIKRILQICSPTPEPDSYNIKNEYNKIINESNKIFFGKTIKTSRNPNKKYEEKMFEGVRQITSLISEEIVQEHPEFEGMNFEYKFLNLLQNYYLLCKDFDEVLCQNAVLPAAHEYLAETVTKLLLIEPQNEQEVKKREKAYNLLNRIEVSEDDNCTNKITNPAVDSEVDIKIKKIIDSYCFKHKRKKYVVTNEMVQNKVIPKTPERTNFMELLELVDKEEILRLKKLYYNIIKTLFVTYLHSEEHIKRFLENKFGTLEHALKQIDSLKDISLGFEIKKEAQGLFFTQEYLDINNPFKEISLKKEKLEFQDIKAIESLINTEKIESEIQFIIFYMLETNDPIIWFPTLVTNILDSISYKTKIYNVNNSIGYIAENDYALEPTHKVINAIKCLNPDEANPHKLMFEITYNINGELVTKEAVNFEQYIATFTNTINASNIKSTPNINQKKLFMQSGINEEKAELLTHMVSSAKIVGGLINIIKSLHCQSYKKILETENVPQFETKMIQTNNSLNENKLKNKIHILQNELQNTKNELSKVTESNQRLEEKLRDEKNTSQQLKKIIMEDNHIEAKKLANQFLAEYFEDAFKENQEDEASDTTNLPYLAKTKITVFGGHPSWRKHIQEYVPNAFLFPKNKTIDEQVIRNSENIWIQVNAISHPDYYKIINIAKTHNVTINFFKFASAAKCAAQIYNEENSID